MSYESLIKDLISLRKSKRVSQDELASRLEVKRAVVGHREVHRSRAHLDELTAWAEALGAELRVELVTNRRQIGIGQTLQAIQELSRPERELLELLLRVLPHIDERDQRSVRVLLDAYAKELKQSQRLAK